MRKQKDVLWSEPFYWAVNPRVNIAGFHRAEPGWASRSTRPVMRDFDLWYVAAGRGRVLLDGRWHEYSAGEVFTIKPGQRYEEERADRSDPFQVYYLHLWPFGDAGSPFNKPLAARLPTRMSVAHQPRLAGLFAEIFEAWTLRREGSPMELKALAIRILDVLFTAIRRDAPAVPPPAYTKLLRAHDFLDHHWREEISLEDVAGHADLSASYLSALFRRHYGCSPMQYQIELRLRSAKMLLAQGGRIGDVAERVGFHSLHYFSRLFKRRSGLAPSQFARQYRSKQPDIESAPVP